jgi:hypothetical protein
VSAARGNKGRLLQVGDWLRATFQTPYPVIFRIAKKIAADPEDRPATKRTGYYGSTERVGRTIVIRIACRPGIRRDDLFQSILHEFAHAVSMRHDKIEDGRLSHGAHDDEWGLAYGKIYRRFYDEGGAESSKNY